VLSVKRVSPLGFLVLAILVTELFVFVPSTTQEFSTETFVTPSPEASLSIKGFSAVHLNQEGRKETIQAKEAELFKKSGHTILKDVNVRIHSKGDHTVHISGTKGKYFVDRKDIEFFGDITIVSENLGYQLNTDFLRYEQEKSLLWSDRTFTFAGPNPDIPSLIVTGKGLEVHTKTEEMYVLSNAHCEKYDEGADSIEIDSDKAQIFLDKYEVLFTGNVVVRQKDMNLFTDNFRVTFNSKDQSIERAVGYDQVKIIQGDRTATCEKAYLLNRDKKIVLKGNPKVMQGNDVIEGEISVFFLQQKIRFCLIRRWVKLT